MRAIVIALGVVALVGGCSASVPVVAQGTAGTGPTLGEWRLEYELSAADAARLNEHLLKRVTLAKSATPYMLTLSNTATGDELVSAFSDGKTVEMELGGCIGSSVGCNKVKFSTVSASEMVGEMSYFDSSQSLKAGPAKVTARLVKAADGSPMPSPSPFK